MRMICYPMYEERSERMTSFIDAQHKYTERPDLDLFHMHTHEGYEIYCFISGTAKFFVEGTIYPLKPNDILIMKKAEAHSLLIGSDAPYERLCINFNKEALLGANTETLVATLDARPLGKKNRYASSRFAAFHWREYLERICQTKDNDVKRLYLTVLMTELCEQAQHIDTTNESSDNIAPIIAYINRHLTEALSLDSLCERFYISKSHLNRKFKRLTGSTVWNYIKSKRLLMAKELLQKGIPPTVVAVQCGFNDYSAFFYAYKAQFSCSPKQDMAQ